MILKDDMVLLRAIEDSDAEILMDLINDPEIEKNVFGWSYPVSLLDQKKWISSLSNDKSIRYAIVFERKTVGTAIVSALDFKNRTCNMNIKLLKEARGKGVASHSLRLLVDYCFKELNMHCLTANIMERNKASQNLFARIGFKNDGVLRDRLYKDGAYQNVCAYSLLKEEYDG